MLVHGVSDNSQVAILSKQQPFDVAKIVLSAVTRFPRDEVVAHMAKHHPHCPPDVRDHIVKEVCNRGWVRTTLGQAVGIVAQNHVRHRSTNYERALSSTHPKDYTELRKKKNRKATEIIKSWSARKNGE